MDGRRRGPWLTDAHKSGERRQNWRRPGPALDTDWNLKTTPSSLPYTILSLQQIECDLDNDNDGTPGSWECESERGLDDNSLRTRMRLAKLPRERHWQNLSNLAT